jgi:hypothetical protein
VAREIIREPKSTSIASLFALAIGRVAVGRMTIRKARFGALEVDELTVRRLHIVEHDGPKS